MAPAGEVKQNDRVVYSINGKEYNGVALSNASVGLHPGHRRASYHLNLIYLNESGSAVKVMAAPLLTEAASSEENAKIAELEHGARSRDHRRATLKAFGGTVTVDDVNAELQARPVRIGWKPYDPGAEARGVKAENDLLEVKHAEAVRANADLARGINEATAQLQAKQSELEAATQRISELQDELATARAELLGHQAGSAIGDGSNLNAAPDTAGQSGASGSDAETQQ